MKIHPRYKRPLYVMGDTLSGPRHVLHDIAGDRLDQLDSHTFGATFIVGGEVIQRIDCDAHFDEAHKCGTLFVTQARSQDIKRATLVGHEQRIAKASAKGMDVVELTRGIFEEAEAYSAYAMMVAAGLSDEEARAALYGGGV